MGQTRKMTGQFQLCSKYSYWGAGVCLTQWAVLTAAIVLFVILFSSSAFLDEKWKWVEVNHTELGSLASLYFMTSF